MIFAPIPCVLYDPRGIEAVVTKVPSWRWMERVSRKICVELGSIASTRKAPRTGREVKDWGIHFTVTKAIGIGRRVRQAQRREISRPSGFAATNGSVPSDQHPDLLSRRGVPDRHGQDLGFVIVALCTYFAPPPCAVGHLL